MLTLVLGKRKSGKSMWAEVKMADRCDAPTYVGTLPAEDKYAESIVAHRKRRGAIWRTIELSGRLDEDLVALHCLLFCDKAVLLDGLSFYLLKHGCGNSLRISRSMLDYGGALISAAALSPPYVVVVDSPVSSELASAQRGMLLAVHRELASYADERWIYRDGQPYPASCQDIEQYSSLLLDDCLLNACDAERRNIS